MSRLLSVDFEVFGRVQGVFFRKHTQRTARRLGVVGWCRNSRDDTVQGRAQGSPEAVAELRRWLQTTGSPMSKIERVKFTDEREVDKMDYESFAVTR